MTPGRSPLSEKLAWRARRFVMPRPLRGEAALAAKGPLVVAGFFRTASGVGASARSCADGLARHGLAPVCVDLSGIFGQVDMPAERDLRAMPADPEGVVILHANAPETERALFKLGLRRRWRVIGVWAWELAEAPASWLRAGRALSELWTLSEFVAGAFRGRLDAPVRCVPPYVAAAGATPDRAKFGVGADAVVCLAMADGRSSFERKNITGAVNAFRAAAEGVEKARLIVKTRNIGEHPAFASELAAAIGGDPRIRHFDASLAAAEQRSLLASADIVVSLHRSEGFGLVLAEAMALGKCVVATGWSGNVDFMPEGAAVRVPFALAPVPAGLAVYGRAHGRSRWAEPDQAAAAEGLRALLTDAGARQRLGEAARRAVAARLDGTALIEALRTAPPGLAR